MVPASSWIRTDETAKDVLVRVLKERPLLVLPPPLHRMPIRVGNVVEIVGPSSSAKTLILIQTAISCILPTEWKGVHYGGLERAVLYIDLDCRFDVLSLSQALKMRITENKRVRSSLKKSENDFDKELFADCMQRFSYTRCYNSFQYLATLKTLQYLLQNEKGNQGSSAHMLMIDSVGAFYWMDHALTVPSSSACINSRKNISLQSITEAIVQEMKRLQRVHPIIVLASRSAAIGDKQSADRRNSESQTFHSRGPGNPSYHDRLPWVWKSFVSHRVLLHPSDDEHKNQSHPTFVIRWILPSVKLCDRFTIVEDGSVVLV